MSGSLGLRGEEDEVEEEFGMVRGQERGVRGEKGEGTMERREGLKGVGWIWRGGLVRRNMLVVMCGVFAVQGWVVVR